ncbi:MAG: DUF3871 family protein [Bacteroidetes bacterium]|nr:DUF3871 family protein [Bacteroidota bacterium]MBU1578486.1 DUF3871 family protein [Bacteroidota bacterium]MBU2557034.1 DUF3871 family protein [Bacteroidota bacterium]
MAYTTEIIRAEPMVFNKTSEDEFIVSNTVPIALQSLKNDCIIPNFAKDNESTISHAEFIEAVMETVAHVFPNEAILEPAIRVSHPIRGRVPEAMGKPARALSEHEKTMYYERMAFSIEIPSIHDGIAGNELSLTVGGVRAYNLENLYSRKSLERFKVFIGFKNHVCTNFCVSTDGFLGDLRVSKTHEIVENTFQLLTDFNVVRVLDDLRHLNQYDLYERQFAQVIGKMKMYQFLPKAQQKKIAAVMLGDSQISTMVKAYYQDENFKVDDYGRISLFDFYNLATGANKSSYIDSFLDRTVSMLDLSLDLMRGIQSPGASWYVQ